MCFTWLRLQVKLKYMKQKSPTAQKYHFTWQRRENLRVDWMLGKELSTKSGSRGATYIIFWMWPSSVSSRSEFQMKNHVTEYILSFNCSTVVFGILILQSNSQMKNSKKRLQAHGCSCASLTVQAKPLSENYPCVIFALVDLRIKNNLQHKQWKAK